MGIMESEFRHAGWNVGNGPLVELQHIWNGGESYDSVMSGLEIWGINSSLTMEAAFWGMSVNIWVSGFVGVLLRHLAEMGMFPSMGLGISAYSLYKYSVSDDMDGNLGIMT